MALQRGAGLLTRRLRLVLGGGVAAVVLAGAAMAAVVVATAPGRERLRRLVVGQLAGAVNGRVTIGVLRGALWNALELERVELTDSAGRPVLRAERIRARYALTDVLRGRYRLRGVELVRPVVILEQDDEGRWTIKRLFRLDVPRPPRTGPAPLVVLTDVRVTDGTVILRQRSADSLVERTATGVDLELHRLRVSHPDSAGVSAMITSMAARLANPALALRGTDGTVRVAGDSLRFAFDRVRLPASAASVDGVVRWGRGTELDVAFESRRFAFADLAGAEPRLPRDGGGRVAGRLRRFADGSVEADLRDLRMTSGGSAASGAVRVTVGAAGGVSVHGMDLSAAPLDLALVGPWVGTLPVRGWVRGRVQGAGALRDLDLRADLAWTDTGVEGAPTNLVAGSGRIALGGREQLAFRGTRLSRASFDFRTIRRFLPAATLTGRLDATGRLDGPWRAARFEGSATHTDGVGPASFVRGSAKWTSGERVSLDVLVRADSLSLDLLRRSFPAIPVTGSVAGPIALRGPLDSLTVGLDLIGRGGAFAAQGTIGIGDSVTRVALAGTSADVDLHALRAALPRTDLDGRFSVRLDVPRDTVRPVTGTVGLALERGVVSAVEVQRAGLLLQLRETRFEVDSLRLDAPGAHVTASGSVSRGSASGRLTVGVRADTLAVFEPLARWIAAERGDTSAVRLDGGLLLAVRLTGSPSAWSVAGDLAFTRATLGGMHLEGVRIAGSAGRNASATSIDLRLAADSAAWGPLAYAPLGIEARGSVDSLTAHVSAGFQPASGVTADLVVWGDSARRTVRLNALRLDLPGQYLDLARPSVIRITPEDVSVDSLELRPRGRGGRFFADGSLPRAGVGDFALFADSVALADVFALAGRDTTGVGGRLDLVVRVAGPAATPTMEAGVALTDGRFGDYRAPLLQALARYSERHLTLKGGLWREDARVVALSGAVPVDLALQAVRRRRLPGPITIQARSDSVDMALLGPLTDLVTGLSGRLSMVVEVAGTWENYSLTGFVDVQDGALTIPALGARYTGADVRLDMARNVVRVTRGRLYAGGELDVGGEIRLIEDALPQLDLTLRAQHFAAFDMRGFAGLTGTGTLTLRGPVLGATLTGRLLVDEGYLKFADLVQKRVVSLDDPEFRAIVDSNLALAQGLGPGAHVVFLDSLRVNSLTLVMGSDVWLRSTEANIQLDGAFTVDRWVEDRMPRYRLDGTLGAPRGTYRLALGPQNSPFAVTRDFRVTRGTVRFFGTPDFNPDLDITAEHQLRTVQGKQFLVFARIGGTLLYPRLALESDERPPLSETEIVSYLVFGQPPSGLTEPGAGNALTQMGLGGQLAAGIVGSVGQGLISDLGLPLDYLTVTPGAGRQGFQAARIGAGARIDDRTYLTLTAGLCEVVTSQLIGAGIEYRISRPFSIAAAFEPVIQECGTSYQLRGLSARYQLSFDLNWQQGYR